MMIGLILKLGVILKVTVAVSTAPATRPAAPVVFLDRFGNTWFQDREVEGQGLIAAIEKEKTPDGELTVFFEPFSLETDRQQVAEFLKKKFPNLRLKLLPAPSNGRFEKLMFPRHHPEAQTKAFSRRNVTWEDFAKRNRQLTDQVKSYLTALVTQWSKARLDINSLQHEYQHLTTRSSGKHPDSKQ